MESQVHGMKYQRFGVEIEFDDLRISDAEKMIRDYFGGEYDHLGRAWSVCRDTTVIKGFELVTPPIYYADLFTLQELFRILRQAGARRAPIAGIHVHVGAEDFSIGQIRSLVNVYSTHAELFLRMLDVLPARRLNYSQSIRPFAEAVDLRNPRTIDDMRSIWYEVSGSTDEAVSRYNASRYTELNLNSYFFRRTIEFRVFNSTNHAGKLRSYVLLVLALVNFAKHYPGLYPLSDTSVENEEQTLAAATQFFDTVGLAETEYRTVREHLIINVKRYYSRVYRPTKQSVIFEGLGMTFDGASFAEILDEMHDNRFFDHPAVQSILLRMRKRKPTAHKSQVIQEMLPNKTYEDYAAALIRLLDNERIGDLSIIE
jgi:Putative amidoligase enzyme